MKMLIITLITNVIGHISNRERINNPHLILGEKREFFKNFIQSSQKKHIKKQIKKPKENI